MTTARKTAARKTAALTTAEFTAAALTTITRVMTAAPQRPLGEAA